MGESKQCQRCGVYVVVYASVRDEICRTCRMERAAPLMLEALRAIYAVARGTIEERAPLVAEQMYAAIKAATGGET